ncbi:hypothetical protein GIB67_029093 [Kingdonia uniflora]|uniref:Uncharacterized protein n=1 Tax=Kingdonia uniflora TaxID=39325 RepID=A0A7J7N718_9MAGN|nr:hypothetical protein GIB67_029093 [Kingdonia uniflora]
MDVIKCGWRPGNDINTSKIWPKKVGSIDVGYLQEVRSLGHAGCGYTGEYTADKVMQKRETKGLQSGAIFCTGNHWNCVQTNLGLFTAKILEYHPILG